MITVLGVGNIILRDEGLGVRAVEFLQNHFEFPAEVQLIDGGTLGIELTYFLDSTDKLLIIDSINGAKSPGTIFRLEGESIKKHFSEKISAHEVGIQDVLTSMEITGHKIPETIVIGAQPFDLDAGLDLSIGMQKIFPWIVLESIKILREWEVNIIWKKF